MELNYNFPNHKDYKSCMGKIQEIDKILEMASKIKLTNEQNNLLIKEHERLSKMLLEIIFINS